MILDRPESRWTAGAVGLLAAGAVVLNIVMVSCQGYGGGAVTSRRATRTTPPPQRSAEPVEAPMPVALGTEPELRVRVFAGVEGVALVASTPGGLLGVSGDANPLLVDALAGATDVGLGQSTTVTLEEGSWVCNGPGGERRLPGAHPLVVRTAQGSTSAPIGVGLVRPGGTVSPGGNYLGRLRLVARTDLSERAFDVIEFVPIETYLPGVVGKELPSGWPAEAYKVQAVCARTYALQERQRSINAAARFDVESSDQDQVYGGTTANAPAIAAVRETRGRVLNWDGSVLRAYYSSTCGGRTASAMDTWPSGPGWEFNRAAPIQAKAREHACQSSPLYRWSVVRDRAELVKRFRAFGERSGLPIKRLLDIGRIEAAAVNADGRPCRYRVFEAATLGATSVEGLEISGEQLRLACNADAPGCASIERSTRVNSSDLEVAIEGETVRITGRGFGHGVGMCQYCAKGFAERGETWTTMLARFYPGATIQTVY